MIDRNTAEFRRQREALHIMKHTKTNRERYFQRKAKLCGPKAVRALADEVKKQEQSADLSQ